MATTATEFKDGTCVEPNDFTGFKEEPNNAIESSGQPINALDRTQLSKASAVFGSRGDFYQESGASASNAYILEPIANPSTPVAVTSITRTGRNVTVTTGASHGFINGQIITMAGAIETDYNGNFLVTVTGSTTFTYVLNGFSISSITRSGSTATATTISNHGYATSDLVNTNGADQTEYNGDFTITVTGPTTFTFTVIGTPTTPATGTIDVVRLPSTPATGTITASINIQNVAGIPFYREGMRIRFRVVNTNVGASTVNVNFIGVVGIVENGSSLIGGELTAGNIAVIIFDEGNDRFEIEGSINLSATFGINDRAGYSNNGGTGEFKVTENSPADQNVIIEDLGGSFLGATGSIFTKPTGSNTIQAIPNADATNPRWDLISLQATTGIYSVTQGTASADPVQPSIPGGEDGIALLFRAANDNEINNRDILDIRVSLNVKNTDGKFITNFSVEQKESDEDSQGVAQQYFQRIPFGTKFDTVQPDKTRSYSIDTVTVPADSHEMILTGAWGDVDSGSLPFRRAKASTTPGDKIELDFFGVAVAGSFFGDVLGQTDFNGNVIVELSNDGGATYTKKKELTLNLASGIKEEAVNFYSGLPLDDYRVKITVPNFVGTGPGLTVATIQYTTYMIQKPTMTYALERVGGPQNINDVPTTVSFISGSNWNFLANSERWNQNDFNTNGSGNFIEFKFYGSKIWAGIIWSGTSAVDHQILIDGSATKVKAATFQVDLASGGTISSWIRLDDGTLSEGIHVVRITRGVAPGSQDMGVSGFGFYSEKSPSTIGRSVILGDKSFLVGIDDPGFTFTGTWTGGVTVGNALLVRQNSTTTQNDTATFTTPNDPELAAIYVVIRLDNAPIGAEIQMTLGGSITRFITTSTDNFDQGSFIEPCYNSFFDGDLSNKVIQFLNNDGNDMVIEGLIFEFKNNVSKESIWCMPKWSRRINSDNAGSVTSIAHRLEVFGGKTDTRPGRLPMVHSGSIELIATDGIVRHGLGYVSGMKIQLFSILGAAPAQESFEFGQKEAPDSTSVNGDQNKAGFILVRTLASTSVNINRAEITYPGPV